MAFKLKVINKSNRSYLRDIYLGLDHFLDPIPIEKGIALNQKRQKNIKNSISFHIHKILEYIMESKPFIKESKSSLFKDLLKLKNFVDKSFRGSVNKIPVL